MLEVLPFGSVRFGCTVATTQIVGRVMVPKGTYDVTQPVNELSILGAPPKFCFHPLPVG